MRFLYSLLHDEWQVDEAIDDVWLSNDDDGEALRSLYVVAIRRRQRNRMRADAQRIELQQRPRPQHALEVRRLLQIAVRQLALFGIVGFRLKADRLADHVGRPADRIDGQNLRRFVRNHKRAI